MHWLTRLARAWRSRKAPQRDDGWGRLADRLDRLGGRLNARSALNYTVSFGVFRAPGRGDLSVSAIVRAALGDEAEVGGVAPASVDDVVTAVRDAITCRGDAGSHPHLSEVARSVASGEVEAIVRAAATLAEQADLLTAVWLRKGHPFYPVFWDFLFVVVHGQDAVVLVGSASD